MTIHTITKEEHTLLTEIFHRNKNLFLQNNGYEYIDKTKFSKEDWKDHEVVEKILRKSIVGFVNFSNFLLSKDGRIRLRFQYRWDADDESKSIPFKGVGYLLLDELLNGFEPKSKEEVIK